MRLANCTCQRVNDYLKEHDSIMLVLGSTENHGRHMPLGTDTMIPDKIAELTEKQSHIMIAPTLPYGATDSLMGFPGTISIGVDGLYDILTRITDSLYEYGFRRFIIPVSYTHLAFCRPRPLCRALAAIRSRRAW